MIDSKTLTGPGPEQKRDMRGTKRDKKERGKSRVRTPIAKYKVSAIDPKYAAVKGSRGPETKCLA
jgi:hypothetical protein